MFIHIPFVFLAAFTVFFIFCNVVLCILHVVDFGFLEGCGLGAADRVFTYFCGNAAGKTLVVFDVICYTLFVRCFLWLPLPAVTATTLISCSCDHCDHTTGGCSFLSAQLS